MMDSPVSFDNASSIDICSFMPDLPLPEAPRIAQATILSSIFIAALALNVTFIVLVATHRSLHQRELLFSLLLAAFHVATCIITKVPNIVSVIGGGWLFGEVSCRIIGTAVIFTNCVRYVFLLGLTADRFGFVMSPFNYTSHSKKVVASIFIVGSMFALFASLMVNVSVLGCYNFDRGIQNCLLRTPCASAWCSVYHVIIWSVIVTFGIVIPFVLYVVMFCKARKLRRAASITCGSFGSSGSGAPPSKPLDSNDTKVTATIILLLLTVVGLTSPFAVFIIAVIVLRADANLFPLALISTDLYQLIPLADALVLMRNRRVRDCVIGLYRKMLRSARRTQVTHEP